MDVRISVLPDFQTLVVFAFYVVSGVIGKKTELWKNFGVALLKPLKSILSVEPYEIFSILEVMHRIRDFKDL